MFIYSFCKKNQRRYSTEFGHKGACNKKRNLHQFWKRSPVLINSKINDLENEHNKVKELKNAPGKHIIFMRILCLFVS